MREKSLTLREVLKEVLNNSYNGHNEGCLNCAEINELVDHFINMGFFRIYKVINCFGSIDEQNINELGYFLRKEFAEEVIEERKKMDKTNGIVGYSYFVEEVEVKI